MKTRYGEEYLSNKFAFPFMAIRINDAEKVVWEGLKNVKSFGLGHTLKVLCVESEDDFYGIIVKVREGKQTRFVPILDLEMIDTKGMNKQYFEEYAEWFANE
jgi:hypothetical protein